MGADDIVTRLRRFAYVTAFPEGGKFLAFSELIEAADEIDRLKRRVAVLENELRLEAAFQTDSVQREAL